MSPSDFSSTMSKSGFWKTISVWIKLYHSRYSLVDGSVIKIEKWDTPSVQRSETPCLPTIFPSFHGNRGQFHFCEEITLRGIKNRNAQSTLFTESSSRPLQMGHCMSRCGWLLWSTILIACHHLFSFVFHFTFTFHKVFCICFYAVSDLNCMFLYIMLTSKNDFSFSSPPLW